MLNNQIKIDCSQFVDQVEAEKTEDWWSEMNLYAYMATNSYLPHLRNKVCVKACPADSVYPELRIKSDKIKHDYYLLASVDVAKKIVYLEGYLTRDRLIEDKNFYKNSYLISFFDLSSVTELTA